MIQQKVRFFFKKKNRVHKGKSQSQQTIFTIMITVAFQMMNLLEWCPLVLDHSSQSANKVKVK